MPDNNPSGVSPYPTRRSRRALPGLLCAAILFILALSLGLGMAAPVQSVIAQGGKPSATPTANGGNAAWDVTSIYFKTEYPDGFEFSIEASSSLGKIKSARVYWQHSPLTGRVSAAGKVDASGTKVTASWAPNRANRLPQWVGVTYWWVLTDDKGNTYTTEKQYDEYADTTRRWSRMESDDIIVVWEEGVPDEIGPAVIQAMAEQREFYKKNFGKLLPYKPRAIIYTDGDAWTEWFPALGGGGLGGSIQGLTEPDWGGTAQRYIEKVGVEGTAYGVVLHEVAHLYQFTMGNSFRDLWFIEGNATYFEIHQDYDYLERVRELARTGRLPTLQQGGPSRSRDVRLVYDVGYAFWVWLQETIGDDAHLKIWTLLSKGRTGRDALQQVTNMSFLDMETAFRTWLGASNPQLPTPRPTQPIVFPPTPTYPPTRVPRK